MVTKSKKSTKKEQVSIVRAENLGKVYEEGKPNEVWAIEDIDLEIFEGEVVSIMGPSGSGKTTLLNCLSGIDEPSRGKVFIKGDNIVGMRDGKKTRFRARKMGFVFQTFNLIPVLTALENVEMPLLINGFSGSEARDKAMNMLKVVGLEHRADHRPNELSGGQRQRVTIARALVHEPAIVWADEPTGNLDTKTANEVFDLMLDLNKRLGITIVVVTHDPRIADKTQRTIKVESGHVVK